MYQPFINDENVKRLHHLKVIENKPMTVLLNKILNDYFQAFREEKSKGAQSYNNESDIEPAPSHVKSKASKNALRRLRR